MANSITDSILESVKKLLNAEGDNYFDADLIMHINTVFGILTQMGVGPAEGFIIDDESATWSDFVNVESLYTMIKTYVALRVKILFDSATASSFYIDTLKQQAEELEWRLKTQAELDTIGGE